MSTKRRQARQYPISAVARLTGVSVDTLREWEHRYEAIAPARNERGRLYSSADVARLQKLAELVTRGHAIVTVAGLSTTELDRLLQGEGVLRPALESPVVSADIETLARALDRYDLSAIESTLNRQAVALPPRDFVFSVVLPLMKEVGLRWETGRLRPAQEHLVSSIIRSLLGRLLLASGRPNASPRLVFATPSGERHELGLLCAALLAATADYGAVYLGPDLPAIHIAHAASNCAARVVIISLTTPGAVARTEVETLGSLLAGTDLWLGGPAAADVIGAGGLPARIIPDLAELVPMLSRHTH